MEVNETIEKGKWDKTLSLSLFSSFISEVYPLKQETVQFIEEKLITIKVSKGKHLIKKDEQCDYLYFVKRGVLRAYVKIDNKEVTTWITGENDFVTAIRGFYLKEPARKNIQAIENCELLALHRDDLLHLYKFHYEMNIIGRLLLERYYVYAEDRALICRLPQAIDRYKYFLETRKNLAGRVPLRYIASYLSIADETLSRIRAKMITAEYPKKIA